MEKDRMHRHVKIVCTLGPASSSPQIIESLLIAGMDIARLNLNYGTASSHIQTVSTVRELSQKLGLPTAILFDLPGTKRYGGSTSEVFGQDLEFARSQKADFAALSFISSAKQVAEVKELLKTMQFDMPLVVKIEKEPALAESESIMDIAQGIMVARGDLANQISIEKVPLAQKRLIKSANQQGKPIITATEMLESMVNSPTPTRAEATDVANAVLDGTDAVMLSEESATGKYPVQAVETMVKIITEAETAFPYMDKLHDITLDALPEMDDAAAHAACEIASQIGAKAIIAFTASGATAIRVSKYRPLQPILAVTPVVTCMRMLTLVWGVYPVVRLRPTELEKIFDQAQEVATVCRVANKGDRVVFTAGFPGGVPGHTNLVKIQVI